MYRLKRHGFTLLELLIVIGIIAIVSAVLFVVLDPIGRFAQARNSKRWQDVNAIVGAIRLYEVEQKVGVVPGVDNQWRMLGTAAAGCNVGCGGGDLVPDVIATRISNNNDDAEEQNPPNGPVNLTSTDLELVRDGGIDQEVGMRFLNVAVPAGAQITNAYIEFTVDEIDAGATNLVFFAEASDNPAGFAAVNGNITNRPKTQAQVAWNNVPGWNQVGAVQQTPDLSPIIQEIINRPGWANGNALVIIVDGNGERTAESHNGSAQQAPRLVVEFGVQQGGIALQAACIDLGQVLGAQLAEVPQDPSNGSAERTYYAARRQVSGQVDVMACSAEDGEIITVTR